MKYFGFLSFGHYSTSPGTGPDAAQMLRDSVELAQAADELGVNGAYFRVHHFAPQAAAPMPLLAAVAATTARIEVGTGVIDLRYENPLYLAEEAAALDLLCQGRLALGVSRGSPEVALRGYEAFGYDGWDDPRGAPMAREKFDSLMRAVAGEPMARTDSKGSAPSRGLRIEPHSPGLRRRIWWGAGTRETAAWAGEEGVNLMSSTLLTEATGEAFSDLQAEQIQRFRETFYDAGHTHTPRVSVSRSILPVVGDEDRRWLELRGEVQDQVGQIDALTSTFGRSYVGEPDQLIAALQQDAAVLSADTLMLTIPSQLGVQVNLPILENFANHVAPALGWQPSTHELPTGYPIEDAPRI